MFASVSVPYQRVGEPTLGLTCRLTFGWTSVPPLCNNRGDGQRCFWPPLLKQSAHHGHVERAVQPCAYAQNEPVLRCC